MLSFLLLSGLSQFYFCVGMVCSVAVAAADKAFCKCHCHFAAIFWPLCTTTATTAIVRR